MLLSKVVYFFFFLDVVHTKDIKCLRCSYFPPQLRYLIINLKNELKQAETRNLTLEEKDIITYTKRAIATGNQDERCLNDPIKLQEDVVDCQPNTCVRQLIRKKTGMKTAASGCISNDDEELIWTMCVCHDDSCEIEAWSPSEANRMYNWISLFILTFTFILSV
ncbi:hypothetical protein M3Y94_00735700 [Aphelenchoides besseyi]|nr:hypothetical protein M3Y94_00735700 [Aphelenchoides besseyi]